MARVNGPYKHGTRYRVVVVGEGGERSTRSYGTEEEALAVIREAKRELAAGIIVGEAVDRFETWLRSTGVRPVTVQSERFRLDRALGKHRGVTVDMLAGRGQRIYDELRAAGYAVQTHRLTLASLRRFGRWLVDQRLVRRPPFANVKPVGKPKRGKPQLRVTEARVLVERCFAELAREDVTAIHPLQCVLLGLRASEAANLECRDVDDEGRLVWVAEAKTDAGKRCVEVPAVLQATLLGLTLDEDGEPRKGQLVPGATRHTVHWHCDRLCDLAGVPPVGPHGLRGTHATLATSAGATAELVMAALGHTSVEVGRRHYTDQTVARAVKGRRAMAVLGAGNSKAEKP